MLIIAQSFKTPDTWVNAVKEFRLPFWDYFRPRGGNTRFPGVRDKVYQTTGYGWDFSIPYILEVEKVMVYKPFDKSVPGRSEDELQEIDNPLFKFAFPKSDGIQKKEWDSLEFETSRSYTVRRDMTLKQQSDHRLLNTVLAQRRESEVETLLNLFYLPYYKEYSIFSNKAVDATGRPTVFGSVEGLHDDYHGHCGGIGHMGRVPVAAFDPVFWLHHWSVFLREVSCVSYAHTGFWAAMLTESWLSGKLSTQTAGSPNSKYPRSRPKQRACSLSVQLRL